MSVTRPQVAPRQRPEPSFLSSLVDLWLRRRNLFFSVAAGYLVLSNLWLALMPFTYGAEAIVSLSTPSNRVVTVGDRFSADEGGVGAELSYLRSQVFSDGLLLSLLSEDRHAYDRLLASRDQTHSLAGIALDALPLDAGGQPTATATPAAGVDEETRTWFRKQLVIERIERSPVVSIMFRSGDPEIAADIANRAAAYYIATQAKTKKRSAQTALATLHNEERDLRDQIQELDGAIQKKKDTVDFLPEDPTAGSEEELIATQRDLIGVRSEREALTAELQQLGGQGREAAAAQASDLLPTTILQDLRAKDAELARKQAELRSELGPRHPQIEQLAAARRQLQERIHMEIEAQKARARSRLRVLASREESLEKLLELLRERKAQSRREVTEIGALDRQRDARTQMLDKVLGNIKEIELQASLMAGDAKVLAAASVPATHSSPRIGILLLANFLASMLVGGAAVVGVQQFDRRLRSADQARDLLGLPLLASLPYVPVRQPETLLQDGLWAQPAALYAEALRGWHLALGSLVRKEAHRVLAVTSALPREGKSIALFGLAAVVARSGLDVVILDLDLRKPTLGKACAGPINAGIEDYLAGRASVEDVLRPAVAEPRLTLLPVRKPPSDPAVLLQSPKLGVLVKEMRGRYDAVFIDTPPTIQLSDCLAIASLVDAIVLILHWNETPADAAHMAVERLQAVGVRPVGTVFTQVNLRAAEAELRDTPFDHHRRYRSYYASTGRENERSC